MDPVEITFDRILVSVCMFGGGGGGGGGGGAEGEQMHAYFT